MQDGLYNTAGEKVKGPEEWERIEGSNAHITLKNNSGTWQVKDHSAASPAFADVTEASGAEYTPPFKIRGVNITYAAGSGFGTLQYNEQFRSTNFTGIVEEFTTGSIHAVSPSKIVFAGCLADYIHLHG